jgi:ABC-2 type transport system permease protein
MAVRDQALLGGGWLAVNAIRVSWLYLKLGVLNELQYRVNFFVSLLQMAIALVTGLVVLSLVYSHTAELNGWTQPELLCVFGIQILMGGLIRTWIQPNMTRLIEEVRDGKLDFTLTKPEDSQVLVSVREVRIWAMVDVISGAIVLGVGISRITSDIGVGDALAFLTSLVLGTILIYCFWLVLATVAFRVVNMWHAVELFDGIFQTGRWPVGIYPPWLRFGVTFLVPIAFAVTVPAEALTSRLDWQTLAFAAVFAVALFAATRWFWRFGLKRYTGASA